MTRSSFYNLTARVFLSLNYMLEMWSDVSTSDYYESKFMAVVSFCGGGS